MLKEPAASIRLLPDPQFQNTFMHSGEIVQWTAPNLATLVSSNSPNCSGYHTGELSTTSDFGGTSYAQTEDSTMVLNPFTYAQTAEASMILNSFTCVQTVEASMILNPYTYVQTAEASRSFNPFVDAQTDNTVLNSSSYTQTGDASMPLHPFSHVQAEEGSISSSAQTKNDFAFSNLPNPIQTEDIASQELGPCLYLNFSCASTPPRDSPIPAQSIHYSHMS